MFTVTDVERYYDEVTGVYLDIYGKVIQALRPTNTRELLESTMKSAGMMPGMQILDAGCGVCGPAVYFAEKINLHIEGLTLSQVQVELGLEEIGKARLLGTVGVRKGDFHVLESYFEPESFDLIMFLESLGHSNHPGAAIRSAHKVTREGGHIYIKDFFKREVGDPEWQAEMDKVVGNINSAYKYNVLDLHEVLTDLRKAGFHIVEIKRPLYVNDIEIRSKFETFMNIDLYEGKPEFTPAEWLEIKCQKNHW